MFVQSVESCVKRGWLSGMWRSFGPEAILPHRFAEPRAEQIPSELVPPICSPLVGVCDRDIQALRFAIATFKARIWGWNVAIANPNCRMSRLQTPNRRAAAREMVAAQLAEIGSLELAALEPRLKKAVGAAHENSRSIHCSALLEISVPCLSCGHACLKNLRRQSNNVLEALSSESVERVQGPALT